MCVCGEERKDMFMPKGRQNKRKTEPQTEEWTKEKHDAFYTFLWSVINPNEMEEYMAMFESKDGPQTCEECEHWNDTEDGCADRHGCTITERSE